MRKQIEIIGDDWKKSPDREVQGFIDQHGNFYDRQQAWVIAEGNGQIIRYNDGCEGTLYSENLY